MRFTSNGPDIPESLLHLHECGHVIFFCGAGVSYPAGLPGFRSLVEQIYTALHTTRLPDEENAFASCQYDTVLELLEHRHPQGRRAVRKALAHILTPTGINAQNTRTHEALLHLARAKDGALRLVTTNFDRLFEACLPAMCPPVLRHTAPLLPIPQNSRWDGIVYLHGLLPEDTSQDAEMQRLVVTSGDFGRAYLLDRWAANFVGSLLRHYTVCFIGYSIEDAVLRYMMDAIAAERALGEHAPQPFAFVPYTDDNAEQECAQWQAKGVRPILYNSHAQHEGLHETLHQWATVYSEGMDGKIRLVHEYAPRDPHTDTEDDGFVRRLLWAIADPSGKPAKAFAEHSPVHSLNWLEFLSKDYFTLEDYPRFGIASPQPQAGKRDTYQKSFSLLRHLDDPEALLWLTVQRGKPHPQFCILLQNRLDELQQYEYTHNQQALNALRLHAPNALPRPAMRTLWEFYAAGRICTSSHDTQAYRWLTRFKQEGMTVHAKHTLFALMEPCLKLSRPRSFLWPGEETEEPANALPRYEIILRDDDIAHLYSELAKEQAWKEALPTLLDDFQRILRDALDMFHAVENADTFYDRSHDAMPSVENHAQNANRIKGWSFLILCVRDAWCALYEQERERAPRIAQIWWHQPYPLYKRLALFAAKHSATSAAYPWVEWLLTENGWWLWDYTTKREVCRLLVTHGAHIPTKMRCNLEKALVAGPPRTMYRDTITQDEWQDIIAYSTWLRLAKLQSSGATLAKASQAHLARLHKDNPLWQLAKNDSDEFSSYMSGTGDPEFEAERESRRVQLPKQRRALAQALKDRINIVSRAWDNEDTWESLCHDKAPTTLCALYALSRENIWPTKFWERGLYEWSKKPHPLRFRRCVSTIVRQMPEDTFQAIYHSIAHWLDRTSPPPDALPDFYAMCERILRMPHTPTTSDANMLHEGINPAGKVTEALIKHSLNDSESKTPMPDVIKTLLEMACDTKRADILCCRAILGLYANALFAHDTAWTVRHIVPLFDWQQSAENAKAIWEGYFYSKQIKRELFEHIHTSYLDTANYYEVITSKQAYASTLVFLSIAQQSVIAPDALRIATAKLPVKGLEYAVYAIIQQIKKYDSDKRAQLFRDAVLPYWQNIWPKDNAKQSELLTKRWAECILLAEDALPDMLCIVEKGVDPEYRVQNSHYIFTILAKTDLLERYPEACLRLLEATVAGVKYTKETMTVCLERMAIQWPDAVHDPHYQRLISMPCEHV